MREDDRQLARRLERDARASAKVQARAARAHARAVVHRDRALARARRAVPAGLVTAGGTAAGAVILAPTAATAATALGVVAGLAGLRVASAVRTLRRPPVVPPPPPPVAALPPPPDPRSVVWPAVRRLEHARAAITRLMPMVTPTGRDAAVEAWQAASEADAALRWQAARIAAVEPHRSMAGDPLLAQLEAGVLAQERLVQAVADLVSACGDPPSTGRLQNAADALHGLAQGLREVR